jgi:hypothetical protein
MREIVFDDVGVERWPFDPSFSILGNFDLWPIFLKVKELLGVDSRDPPSVVVIDNPLNGSCRAFAGIEPTFKSDY